MSTGLGRAAGLALRASGRALRKPRRSYGQLVARAAVLAAFVRPAGPHMAYAGFFEDPITWVLLALGAAARRQPEVRAPA